MRPSSLSDERKRTPGEVSRKEEIMRSLLITLGRLGGVLALILLVIALLRQLIALVGFLLVAIKIAIVVIFVAVVILIVFAILRDRSRHRREAEES